MFFLLLLLLLSSSPAATASTPLPSPPSATPLTKVTSVRCPVVRSGADVLRNDTVAVDATGVLGCAIEL